MFPGHRTAKATMLTHHVEFNITLRQLFPQFRHGFGLAGFVWQGDGQGGSPPRPAVGCFLDLRPLFECLAFPEHDIAMSVELLDLECSRSSDSKFLGEFAKRSADKSIMISGETE